MKTYQVLFPALALLLSGCFTDAGSNSKSQAGSSENPDNSQPASGLVYGTLKDLTANVKNNNVPYIPAQCYTNPVDADGTVSNPCYACHTESKRPNFLNDTDVQEAYNFPESVVTNQWSNIFKDRTAEVAQISDESILKYVREDNYKTADGRIILAEKLKNLPAQWDHDGNGQWDGYTPDVYFAFDEEGFDHAPDGGYSGWRVFAYYPFLGTFMPTNGSTDDVMIRLSSAFRQLTDGVFDKETYMVNLAIVEALMKEQDIVIPEVDENRYQVDLNKDGMLGKSTLIKYKWAPQEGVNMSYVGLAKAQNERGEIHLAARLYPEGTEFLHSVRYLDVNESGQTAMAARMKELRYSKKHGWRSYYNLRTIVDKETKERHDFPDRVKLLTGNMELGLFAPHGWTYQGFIEDDAGQLRPQSYEETFFCMGCHGYTGASNDTTISFTRKLDHTHFRQGWYHWSDKSLAGIADPAREDGHGEYAYYLENNPSGNEYRTNDEVRNKFFNADSSKKADAFNTLSSDISYLLMPSAGRALKMNKSYKVIVDEQSFDKGRDAVIEPLRNVHKEVEVGASTGIKDVLSFY